MSILDDWLTGRVNFGGEWMSRAQVFQWFERNGYPCRAAELWLLGYQRTH